MLTIKIVYINKFLIKLLIKKMVFHTVHITNPHLMNTSAKNSILVKKPIPISKLGNNKPYTEINIQKYHPLKTIKIHKYPKILNLNHSMLKSINIKPSINSNGWGLSGGTHHPLSNSGSIDLSGNVYGNWHGNTGSSITYGTTLPIHNGSIGGHCTTGIGGISGIGCSLDISVSF